jgi:hypothetical protein
MHIFSNYIEIERWEKAFKDLSHLNFSLFNEYQPTYDELNKNPINILLIGSEPNEYFGNHDFAVRNQQAFSFILTWSTKVLNTSPNSIFTVYGESWWQDNIFEYTPVEKEFKVSFLRGNLLKLIGHTYRYELFDRQHEIKIPIQFWDKLGERGVDSFEKWRQYKIDSFRPYQYSVCIENSSHENYFTEKITDCILNKTIPIYYGCSNIDDFYNPKGIIQVKNTDEMIKVINNLEPEYYNSILDIIEENYQKAFEYKDYVGNIKKQILNIFKYNNLL